VSQVIPCSIPIALNEIFGRSGVLAAAVGASEHTDNGFLRISILELRESGR